MICACKAFSSVLRRLTSSLRTVAMSFWIFLTMWSKDADRFSTSRTPVTGS